MQTSRVLIRSLPVLFVSFCACGPITKEDSDCAYAEESWGQKTAHLGESCSAGSYGACDEVFDNCIEGECVYTTIGSVCSDSCSSDADCSWGTSCSDGYCQAAASCSTFCDGTCCCSYYNDPNDPTQCVQGSCSCSV